MKDLYLSTFKQYANFKGRASKKEFWTFIGINIIISFVLSFVLGMFELQIFSTLFSLIVLLPTLAVGARRMHDIGKSGWFFLIPLYNLYLALQEGEPTVNKWGVPPVV